MAFPGYAPFTYGQSSQQTNPYFSYAQNTSYNSYPYSANTPRYANNGAYLPQGTPYSNQVPFPNSGGGYPQLNNNGSTPYTAPPANIPDVSPAPFIPPMPEGADLGKSHHSSRKNHHKSSSIPAANAAPPIKSAMKRSATVMPSVLQPQVRKDGGERKRTASFGMKQPVFQNTSPVTRTRTKSDVKPSYFDLAAEMERFESGL